MDQAISCYTNSGTGTDLSDPITAAAYELVQHGRPGITKGIILMSDGQPNNSTTSGPNYCAQSFAAAKAAKDNNTLLVIPNAGADAMAS